MRENDIIKELLRNGFSEASYKSVVTDKCHTQYLSNHRDITVIVNGWIELGATEDKGFRIEFLNGKMMFLGNHQDYWGGWYKNRLCMKIESIETIKVVCSDDVLD